MLKIIIFSCSITVNMNTLSNDSGMPKLFVLCPKSRYLQLCHLYLSRPLGEVWTDGLPASREMEHDHRYVVHDEGYVSEEGVHTNQAECLWSLLQPGRYRFLYWEPAVAVEFDVEE